MEYTHLLSPVSINGITLKSRMTHAKSSGGLDGTDKQFEKATRYYTNVARNGAALVCMIVGTWPDCEGKRSVMSRLNMDDPEIQAGFTRMIEEVHRYGTLCTASLMNVEPQELNISHLDKWDFRFQGDYNPNFKNKPEISAERIEGMIEDFVFQCSELKRIGFDGVTFYMSYRASILANAISPVLNQRKDQWGGSTLEERARLPLTVFHRVKEACGRDFLIEIQTSAEEEKPGYDVEYWLDFCKMCEGLVDIFQVRGLDGSYTHVGGYNSSKESPWNLQFAERFKQRGIRALVAPVGGFGDPDSMERFIAEGKTDLIAMARQYLADSSMGEKLREGRGEDVTPCLRCMGKCDRCSVNPYRALVEEPDLFNPSGAHKRIAVVGGGAAGMRAAITAAENGHDVTLYEKTDCLGGQMNIAGMPDFKWNLRDYCRWMIRQMEKSGCRVLLNTEATPEMISQEGFDAVILAMGSDPKTVPVPGADRPEVFLLDDAFRRENELGHRVVVVGGGASGKECALYLARQGHEVTLLTRHQAVFAENNHCIWAVEKAYREQKNLHVVEFADTVEIGPDYVVADVKTNYPRRKLTFNGVSEMLRAEEQDPVYIDGFLYPEYPMPVMMFGPPPKAKGGKPSVPGSGNGMQPIDESLDEKTKSDMARGDHGPGFAHEPEVIPTIDEKDIIWAHNRYDCDSVVVSGGRQSRILEAERFRGAAQAIYVVGDNVKPGSIQECTNTAFAAVMDL